jgi:protein-S-isoprenylcysteine O-methyltransferase Ste14
MHGRLTAILGSTVFFLIAPGTLAGLAPWWISGRRIRAPFFGWAGIPGVGAALIAGGVFVLLDCFARFALEGRGTPAPALPTDRLVIAGAYRFLRNPMYLAVCGTILGEALLLGSLAVLGYLACLWLGFHAFVLLYEEPPLKGRYGPQYERYCAEVSRWLPRLRPWRGEDQLRSDGRPGEERPSA